jgi:hypothetical protein
LASKPLFRNHLFICGCAFLLSGLTDKSKDPWLLYFQLSLIYLGAVLNKVLQIDWWNGQFMHNWLLEARENPYYEIAHEIFPNRILPKILSWSSMAIELSISFMLLFKKYHRTAVWTILIFHTTILTFTASRFGHFFEDIVIYLLVFSSWPEGPIQVTIDTKRALRNLRLLRFFNWNNQWVIKRKDLNGNHWLGIKFSNKEYYDKRAFGYLVLYTPATYFILLFFDSGIQFLFNAFLDYPLNKYGLYFTTLLLLWGGIIFFGSLKLKQNFLLTRQSKME